MDLRGDYGDQQDRLRAVIDDFGAKLARAKISKGVVMYMVEAVLIPRVMYPITVIPFTPDHIRHLESRALRWILPKLGLTRSFARDLVGAEHPHRLTRSLGCAGGPGLPQGHEHNPKDVSCSGIQTLGVCWRLHGHELG